MAYKSGVTPTHLEHAPFKAFQSIFLRLIASAPWHVTNKALQKDLKADTVLHQLAKIYYIEFHTKLQHH